MRRLMLRISVNDASVCGVLVLLVMSMNCCAVPIKVSRIGLSISIVPEEGQEKDTYYQAWHSKLPEGCIADGSPLLSTQQYEGSGKSITVSGSASCTSSK